MSHAFQGNCGNSDGEESLWGYVTANTTARHQDRDGEGSTVMVSRGKHFRAREKPSLTKTTAPRAK